MKIVLNPEYKFLQQFVQDLPTRFASEGKVIQDKRNTIKVFEYKELEINVKRYRVPILINRIAYRFFRKSKAVKAYFNSLEVRKRGFNTPESIACIETFRGGLLHYSYYISLQCLSVPLRVMKTCSELSPATQQPYMKPVFAIRTILPGMSWSTGKAIVFSLL